MSEIMSEYLDKIDMYANGIMRDKNEMDKVWIQASSIRFLVGRVRIEVEQLKAENKQLRQALQRCSPHTAFDMRRDENMCYDCESLCNEEHEPNCEYARLYKT